MACLQGHRELLRSGQRPYRRLGGGDGVRLPRPLNVALGGEPKIDGCGVGDGLHDASVAHGGS